MLDQEFGSALAELRPVLGWEPSRTSSPLTSLLSGGESERLLPEPQLRIRTFPLLRGFSRPPLNLLPSQGAIVRRLLRHTPHPGRSPLIVTTPFFAGVAERWPGPVVYWLTDLIAEYLGSDRKQVKALDTRLCRAATLVCPNSNRLAEYLLQQAGCERTRIHILPNATRAANLLPFPPRSAAPLPADVEHLPRPVAGVIGNLAGNMDWELLLSLANQVPDFSWLFVGPTAMRIKDPLQSAARDTLMQLPRARFIGARPYGSLAAYARAFDVAVLPYRRHEPTYSGSSTRFYEHLAACRPMLATRGFEELLHKEPLLTLIDSADEAAAALDRLAAANFDDGLTRQRWLASRDGTWHARASSLVQALETRRPL